MFKFGVEIEMHTSQSDSTIAEGLERAGVNATRSARTNNPETAWGVKYDGSVSNGWELVSPVLVGSDGLEQVKRVCNAISAIGDASVSRSTGLHVHLSGINDLEVGQVANIARRFVNFEDTMDLMHPASRRDNTYCRSNMVAFGYDPVEASRKAWERSRNLSSIRDAVSIFNPNGRYYKLNLHSLLRHNTIEFRQHAGTISAEKILNWIAFVHGFSAVAVNQSRLYRRKAGEVNHVDRFEKMMRGMSPAVRRFYRGRLVAINPELRSQIPASRRRAGEAEPFAVVTQADANRGRFYQSALIENYEERARVRAEQEAAERAAREQAQARFRTAIEEAARRAEAQASYTANANGFPIAGCNCSECTAERTRQDAQAIAA